LAQMCTKSFCGWALKPQTPLGELTALLRPIPGKGELKGGEGREGEGKGRKRKRKMKTGEGGERKGREGSLPPLKFKSGYALEYKCQI